MLQQAFIKRYNPALTTNEFDFKFLLPKRLLLFSTNNSTLVNTTNKFILFNHIVEKKILVSFIFGYGAIWGECAQQRAHLEC